MSPLSVHEGSGNGNCGSSALGCPAGKLLPCLCLYMNEVMKLEQEKNQSLDFMLFNITSHQNNATFFSTSNTFTLIFLNEKLRGVLSSVVLVFLTYTLMHNYPAPLLPLLSFLFLYLYSI